MFKVECTSRLSFRLMDKNDAEALWLIDQDPEVMHFLNGGKPSTKTDINEIMIPRMLSYRDENKGWGIWQVCDVDTQEYLGWVLVRPMNFFSDEPNYEDIELGWRFFKNAWGKGYASEAAKALTHAIASQSDPKFVSALAVEENLASIGVMKKIGMRFKNKYLHTDPIGDFPAVHYQKPIN
ncbi:MAG: GNAT family N-acetyltransferase [Colwellia sp.]